LKNLYLSLDKILDLKKWQDLQDSLADLTRLAIITVDYKGYPITAHSSCHPFCQAVRKDGTLAKHCHKCDSRGGLEAARTNAPYIYLCHYNIIDIAVPIVIDDKYLGAIMAGQIKLSNPDNNYPLEQIFSSDKDSCAMKILEEKRLLYDTIPHLTYEEIKKISLMLYRLCNYIVEEAMNKNVIIEMYDKMFQFKQEPESIKAYPDYSPNNMETIKKKLASAVTNAYIKSTPNDNPYFHNSVLRPAFEYIYNNKGKNASQNDLAALCHISSGYFSRIFAKETGENFSVYHSRLKIEWSKQLLEKTEISITQISDELGFSEPGYFIKTFKKFENITPALYRKYYKETSYLEI